MSLFSRVIRRRTPKAPEEAPVETEATSAAGAATPAVDLADIGSRVVSGRSRADAGAQVAGKGAGGTGASTGEPGRSPGRGGSTGPEVIPGTRSGTFSFEKLDEVAARIAEESGEEDELLDVGKLSRADRKALRAAMEGSLDAYPYLMALKPRERYVFRSDYFEVDDQVACIMGFFHADEARDDFGVFWGINRVPNNLEEGVTAIVFEQVARMSDKWVDDRLKTSDRLDKLESKDQMESGTASSRRKAAKMSDDMRHVVAEVQDGAAYLSVHNRLLLRAPDLATLDRTIDRIRRLYIDRFSTLTIAPHHGEQRQELSNLFSWNKNKRGTGFHYTSVEYAGSHSLVTNGLNDPTGEYVGFMQGDVNNSAVLLDVNGYRSHVVCADDSVNRAPILAHLRPRMVDLWGTKISQAALLSNARVVHLVLNGAPVEELGPPLSSITTRLDMSSGDVNMFEVFGSIEDELSLFSSHLNKLVLMVEQAYGADEKESLALIRGKLQDLLKRFYVDQRMWAINAKENREDLRLVGIPHKEVPRLQVFITYLDTEYEAMKNADRKDENVFKAVSVLRMVIRNLLDNHGDLFNQHTSDRIDSVNQARRVVYDFSGLVRRGRGIAMAQLVNVVGFAVESLGPGDTVIIHGAQTITDRAVQDYLTTQFGYLRDRGGRTVFLYDDVDSMLANQSFNFFNRADWTVLGPMSGDTVAWYQELLNQSVAPDLLRLITWRDSGLSYLRRGTTNVVFKSDLAIGVNPWRKKLREQRRAALAGGAGREAAAALTMEGGTALDTGTARDANRGGGTSSGPNVDVHELAAESRQEERNQRVEASSAVAQLEREEAELRRSREELLTGGSGG